MTIYSIYSGDAYRCNGIWILTHEDKVDIEKLYRESGEGDPDAFVSMLIEDHGFVAPPTVDLHTD